ncbi:unnamed protein product [Phytophthora lilii]|uniref:Unnamed protein product n=1 Tax=Phytophthora lilii TaxID=2077276 RepID=A0A9W6X3D0_9STRA|nr:unnamed protein product [Phytophthora lilii]
MAAMLEGALDDKRSSKIPPDSSAVLNRLMTEVQQIYPNVDKLLAESLKDDKQNPFFEFMESQSVPFARDVVDRAVWGGIAYRLVEETKNTISVCAHVVIRQQSGDCLYLQTRLSGRKYRAVGRAASACRTKNAADPSSLGVRFHETHVRVVIPNELPPDWTGCDSTTIHTCVTVTHNLNSQWNDRRAKVMWQQTMEARKPALHDFVSMTRNQMPEATDMPSISFLTETGSNMNDDILGNIAPPRFSRCHSLEFIDRSQACHHCFSLDMPKVGEEIASFDVDDILDQVVNSHLCAENSNPNVSADASGSEESDESAREAQVNSRNVVSSTALKSKRGPRVTPKDRLIRLRYSVGQLTQQLEKLQASHQKEVQAGVEHDETRIRPLKRPVWQQIAAGQLERRRKAEQDNAQLRAMVQVQMEEARNLKRLLKRRTKLEYAEKSMHNLPWPGHKETVDPNMIGDGVFLEIMHQNVVPFAFRETKKAVWACLSEIGMRWLEGVTDCNKQVDFHSQHMEKSSNTMVTSYLAETSGPPLCVEPNSKSASQVCRRKSSCVYLSDRDGTKLEESHASIGVRFLTTLRVVVQGSSQGGGDDDDDSQLLLHLNAARQDLGSPISLQK